MADNDRDLGMNANITRRDFVHGVAAGAAVSAGAVASSVSARAAAHTATQDAKAYPPLRNGMRGFHPGAFEPIHALAWSGIAPPDATFDGETYDLVIVGGGLSGLASAYYYRKQAGPSAKILILDNLEGIGGHAQRNEFEYNGHVRYTAGGSGYIVSPSQWSREARIILDDLGIARNPRRDRTDVNFYKSLGMSGAVLFPDSKFGANTLVHGSLQNPTPEFLHNAPLSDKLKADLVKLYHGKTDYLAGKTDDEKYRFLHSISYRDYLLKVVGISEDSLQFVKGVWCVGLDMGTAWFAFFRMRPGFDGLGLKVPDKSPESEEAELDDYELPAGNSDVARLIVRSLIPDALPRGDMFDIAEARLDYTVLDRASNATRIRHSSIVYDVRHVGPQPYMFQPEGRIVQVSYLKDGKTIAVRGANVVLACMNNVIPHICPGLPALQQKALTTAIRAPNQMTNVLFRNWKPFVEAKVAGVTSPWTFYGSMGLARPRYFGTVKPAQSPDEPIIVSFGTGGISGILTNTNMVRGLCGEATPQPGTSGDEQFKAVRRGLLATPFETFERAVRTLSTQVLAGTSFDPAKDILAVTVNRWSHGFATGLNDLFDKDYQAGMLPPTVVARQKFGRITIANSDAGGTSTMQTAFEQAWRAIDDLQSKSYGFYEHI